MVAAPVSDDSADAQCRQAGYFLRLETVQAQHDHAGPQDGYAGPGPVNPATRESSFDEEDSEWGVELAVYVYGRAKVG